MPNLSRSVFDSLLPDGSFWHIAQDGNFDKLLDGMSDNVEDVILKLACLSCIRDPHTTPILSDLEKEFGINPDERLTDEERRQALAAKVYRGDCNGSKDCLEDALQMAGFDVQVCGHGLLFDAVHRAQEFYHFCWTNQGQIHPPYPSLPGICQ